MAEVQLAAHARPKKGSAESRRLRAAGKVPAVLYGHGVEPRPLVVDARELRSALSGAGGLNALLSLEVDSARHLAMARQLQRHPLRGTLSHVDFVIVRRDEIVSADVPVRLAGEASQVTRSDGVIEQQLFNLAVQATPGEIPPHLEVDISGMAVGDTVRVGDLKLPAGVATEVDPEEPVVVATASTVSAEIAAEEEAATEETATEEAAAEGRAAQGAEPPGEGGGSETGAAEG
ncbi:MAG TPA: 50S ribosomal protein L25 [Acidimicrobiales bacterium]|jgi:large subunit ribosomal protein L25|nr:50S ribosomal protein L25 [Acidimicrobiales bacterium]